LALLQLDYVRNGRTNPVVAAVTSVATWLQLAAATVANGTRDGIAAIVAVPQLARENAALRAQVASLTQQTRAQDEVLAQLPAEASLVRAQSNVPDGVAATVIAFDPENAQRIVTIDKGAHDRISRDDGVITGDGVVGRVIEVDPFSSKVLLIDDPTSRLPALVQRGRWWAIAVGTQTRVKLRFIPQDAKLRVGDRIVTGEGRSFHAGMLIGTLRAVDPTNAGALDQSALVEPAAHLAALSRVLVIRK
jgi:rod shape-determining protein MreC